jgi:hypothetical protein
MASRRMSGPMTAKSRLRSWQAMFGRWSQENYFKHAGEHRDLDALVTQEMDPADGTRLSFPILSARSRKPATCQSPCSATRGH